jgi:NTP pyrophosphatase (non-canonical NTP hydrolase)
MENSDNSKSSSKAMKVEYSVIDRLSFFFNFLAMFLNVVLIMIQEAFGNLLPLIVGQKFKNISGQLALVTGGANGLGKAIAFRLAQEGCNVVTIDLFLKEAQEVASKITKKFNVKASAYKVDVSDFDAVQKLKDEIEKSLGTVDILVNNAGVLPMFSFREVQPSEVQNLINVNLTAHFWVDSVG